MNEIIKTILRKLAEIARYEYESLDLSKWINYTWTQVQEDEFRDWLAEYLYSLTTKDLGEITRFPRLIKGSKKRVLKLVNEYILQYGFKTKDL